MNYIKEVIMRKLFPRVRLTARNPRPNRPRTIRLALESLEERSLLDAGMTGFTVTNLLSDLAGVAAHTDVNLVNPWGFAETPGGQFQVAANGSGDTIHINARGDVLGKDVPLQPPLGSPPGTTTSPNGTFLNTTSDFVISDDGKSAPAQFVFSTEDGTLVGFNPAVDPKEGVLVFQASDGAVYKLLAEASTSKGNFLYATDFHNNKIDVFDKNFDKVTLGTNGFETFTDPNEPAGFAPFGIKLVNLGGQNVLLVSYAKQLGPDNHDDQEGPGNGFIDEFTTTGHFIKRFASGSAAGGTDPLNSPIGMTIAPQGFGPNGKFSNALLVGNFGDSTVSAFDLNSGTFLGQLSDAQGKPLVLNGGVLNKSDPTNTKGLWGIAFGNGHGGTDPNALYFAAGVNGENDGLFGKVTMGGSDNDHGPDHDAALTVSHAASVPQHSGVANLFAPNSTMAMSNMMMPPPSMMPASNGMMPPASAAPTPAQIDAFFQMLDADLIALESSILARMPQLEGLIGSYNAMVTMVESSLAGHPIGDLSGKV
jgi:uncharacterized protein (TIGR03118 family)